MKVEFQATVTNIRRNVDVGFEEVSLDNNLQNCPSMRWDLIGDLRGKLEQGKSYNISITPVEKAEPKKKGGAKKKEEEKPAEPEVNDTEEKVEEPQQEQKVEG